MVGRVQLTKETGSLFSNPEWQYVQGASAVLPSGFGVQDAELQDLLSIVEWEAVQLKSSRQAGIFGSLLSSVLQDDTKRVCFLA